jgi:hypothetical protein
MLRKITIEFTDDPNKVRNFGVGDYFVDKKGNKIIRVYQKDNSEKWSLWAFLCAMHELTEYELCDRVWIKEEDVDAFDKWFESQNLEGEPGDHEDAPYRKQHRSAEMVERYICEQLNLDWHEYFKNYVIPEDFKYNEDYGKDKTL